MVWEWEWDQGERGGHSTDEEEPHSIEVYNPYLYSDAESFEGEVLPTQMHTATIESVHNHSAKEALSKESIILQKSGHVQTIIETEPENEYNTNAIAFCVTLRVSGKELGML